MIFQRLKEVKSSYIFTGLAEITQKRYLKINYEFTKQEPFMDSCEQRLRTAKKVSQNAVGGGPLPDRRKHKSE